MKNTSTANTGLKHLHVGQQADRQGAAQQRTEHATGAKQKGEAVNHAALAHVQRYGNQAA